MEDSAYARHRIAASFTGQGEEGKAPLCSGCQVNPATIGNMKWNPCIACQALEQHASTWPWGCSNCYEHEEGFPCEKHRHLCEPDPMREAKGE